MPRRTQLYQKIPWTGGLNSAVDPGVLPDDDLVVADNVVFGTSGSRLRREGYDYLDAGCEIPAVISRSSSGTTRTLVFASTLLVPSPVNQRLVVGEWINVSGNVSYAVEKGPILTITTTNVTDDTITYTATSSLTEGATATSNITVARGAKTLDAVEYWRWTSTAKEQMICSATSQGKFFSYTMPEGKRTELIDAGTPITAELSIINHEVMNETIIWAFDVLGVKAKKYRPESSSDVQDLGGNPPDFSFMRSHQGRLWTNQKDDLDRLNYSPPGDIETWNGTDDSGGIDIRPGDGDPEGVKGIMPPFRGALFVGKRTHLYQVVGDAPENYQVVDFSNGLGIVSHKATCAVDLNDVVFVSEKGVHSLSTTANYGDFQEQFLSSKIQNDFNKWDQSRLKYIQTTYLPEANSVAFAVTTAESGGTNNDVYFYNSAVREWYKWPDVSCECVTVFRDAAGKRRLMFGTGTGRIIAAQNGTFLDFGTDGAKFRIKTGTIYVDGSPVTLKAFKKIGFLFKPKGDFQFTVTVKIDNHTSQSLTFEQTSSGDLLGSTFVLGSSILGVNNSLAPYTQSIDGIGRGIVVEITQSGSNEQVELYGVIIEFEPADIAQEVLET
jgi:hypothetical protein